MHFVQDPVEGVEALEVGTIHSEAVPASDYLARSGKGQTERTERRQPIKQGWVSSWGGTEMSGSIRRHDTPPAFVVASGANTEADENGNVSAAQGESGAHHTVQGVWSGGSGMHSTALIDSLIPTEETDVIDLRNNVRECEGYSTSSENGSSCATSYTGERNCVSSSRAPQHKRRQERAEQWRKYEEKNWRCGFEEVVPQSRGTVIGKMSPIAVSDTEKRAKMGSARDIDSADGDSGLQRRGQHCVLGMQRRLLQRRLEPSFTEEGVGLWQGAAYSECHGGAPQ
ncbi:hypothetical protein DQ04_03121000 [Trypanosoma grayi]|uniref:hypothetical protein n=1 Tax=Trypanosoma grayi TaxID=71804 RepID=UPI0004F41FBC|nr:hypothetical protein DQ04_03121000 [Trypanosoma grayi]KEG10948.1 hypothetical protein DQ04_03121000 [Trypanosoma grayi]